MWTPYSLPRQSFRLELYTTGCKQSPRNLRALLLGGLNRPPTGSPFKRGSVRRYSDWTRNFPACSLSLEVYILEPTCHKFPHGQLPMWWLPAGSILRDEYCWLTQGTPQQSARWLQGTPFWGFQYWQGKHPGSPMGRLAKTPMSIKNRNQNSFSTRVLGKFWSQTKKKRRELRGLVFSQPST